MGGTRRLPAKERPGWSGWFGPLSLCLGVISWPIPAAGPLLGVVAVIGGAASMSTQTEYRLDWTAIVGTGFGAAQLLMSVLLLVMSASGL